MADIKRWITDQTHQRIIVGPDSTHPIKPPIDTAIPDYCSLKLQLSGEKFLSSFRFRRARLVDKDADLRENINWKDRYSRGWEQRYYRQCQDKDSGFWSWFSVYSLWFSYIYFNLGILLLFYCWSVCFHWFVVHMELWIWIIVSAGVLVLIKFLLIGDSSVCAEAMSIYESMLTSILFCIYYWSPLSLGGKLKMLVHVFNLLGRKQKIKIKYKKISVELFHCFTSVAWKEKCISLK